LGDGAAIIIKFPGPPPLAALPGNVLLNHHSPERQLIELRMEHADLNAAVDRLAADSARDDLLLQRLKKRRLALRDKIAQLEMQLEPKEPA
jgi:hypothetical protein